MKRIIAALSLALGASGCFWSEGGAISASWSISVGGAAATCDDVGGHTVEIVSTRVSSGTVYKDLYDCVDYHGVTSDVRPGLYDVVVRLYDDKGNQLSDDFPVEVDVTSNDTVNAGSFDFAFQGNGGGGGGGGGKGRFAATWIVSINGEETTCEDVGASLFEIVTKENAQGGFQRTFSFPCSASTGTTDELPAGTYTVDVRLLDANRAVLSNVTVGTVGVDANETKSLGGLNFTFNFHSASLRVKMGSATGGNCVASSSQGAGVVQQEIQIFSSSRLQCLKVPISGVRDQSDQAASTEACTGYFCQAETTNHTVEHLAKGSYSIRVLGYKSGFGGPNALCYISPYVDFTVGDTDLDLGTIVAAYDTSFDTQQLCSR